MGSGAGETKILGRTLNAHRPLEHVTRALTRVQSPASGRCRMTTLPSLALGFCVLSLADDRASEVSKGVQSIEER